MGMHFGVIAATTTWHQFFAALSAVTGDFIDRGPVACVEDCDLSPVDGGSPILGGEYLGSAYLLDTSMLLSATNYDRLLGLSDDLASVVVACVGETVSGSFGLLVAKNGELLRLYYNCTSGLHEPFQMGDSLPTESVYDLEDIDGVGLFAALGHFGLDYDGWYEQGTKRSYLYTCKELDEEPEMEGPIDAALREHWGKHEIPHDEVPAPQVVSRVLPDGRVAFDIVASGPRQTLLDRIRAFFSRS